MFVLFAIRCEYQFLEKCCGIDKIVSHHHTHIVGIRRKITPQKARNNIWTLHVIYTYIWRGNERKELAKERDGKRERAYE